MRNDDAVWITGVGTANPLGTTFEAAAENLLAGRSGISRVTEFAIPEHLPHIAGRIGVIPTPPFWDPKEFCRLDRWQQVLLWCCGQALISAGWWERRSEVRVGLVLGLGAEWLLAWSEDQERGGNRIHDPEQDRESLVEVVQRRLGLTGPGANVAAACASGNYALALGRRWVRRGWVDVCLAGGVELPLNLVGFAGFGNLRTLSRKTADPEGASRPFDRGRDGLVLGEGGAMFVLESAGRARRRGAPAYAEFVGFGASSDAAHLVIPSTDPAPGAAAMRLALADAAVAPEAIDYLNAHATSTPLGDAVETSVVKTALASAAARVPVSSTKSMTGHLLSGAAAINALACLVSLERGAIPPTINLDDPDPSCDLCHVAHQARPAKVRVAVSNSFGFGGCNTCIVLRKVA
jgi:3-oxoacyl-[acyl-carrier-protein] synthase II